MHKTSRTNGVRTNGLASVCAASAENHLPWQSHKFSALQTIASKHETNYLRKNPPCFPSANPVKKIPE